MTFELKIQTDEEGKTIEIIEESITKTEQTKKRWSRSGLEDKIIELKVQIDDLEERKTILETQLKRLPVAKEQE